MLFIFTSHCVCMYVGSARVLCLFIYIYILLLCLYFMNTSMKAEKFYFHQQNKKTVFTITTLHGLSLYMCVLVVCFGFIFTVVVSFFTIWTKSRFFVFIEFFIFSCIYSLCWLQISRFDSNRCTQVSLFFILIFDKYKIVTAICSK